MATSSSPSSDQNVGFPMPRPSTSPPSRPLSTRPVPPRPRPCVSTTTSASAQLHSQTQTLRLPPPTLPRRRRTLLRPRSVDRYLSDFELDAGGDGAGGAVNAFTTASGDSEHAGGLSFRSAPAISGYRRRLSPRLYPGLPSFPASGRALHAHPNLPPGHSPPWMRDRADDVWELFIFTFPLDDTGKGVAAPELRVGGWRSRGSGGGRRSGAGEGGRREGWTRHPSGAAPPLRRRPARRPCVISQHHTLPARAGSRSPNHKRSLTHVHSLSARLFALGEHAAALDGVVDDVRNHLEAVARRVHAAFALGARTNAESLQKLIPSAVLARVQETRALLLREARQWDAAMAAMGVQSGTADAHSLGEGREQVTSVASVPIPTAAASSSSSCPITSSPTPVLSLPAPSAPACTDPGGRPSLPASRASSERLRACVQRRPP
ncbi:hypothetical protein DFH09DRAFT_459569 [Mycena vulgaris]|nr:hypothetical protein DFH09DRAFT_459569 [Mycena vulgaris]